MTKLFLNISFFLLLTTFGCRNRDHGVIPSVPFERTLNILTPEFFELQVPGGWVYHTGGSRGLIIYRKSDTEFTVLERHSTFEPQNSCAVVVAEDGVIVEDPCSDSQWLIMDGSIVNGPAAVPLRVYNWSYQEPYLYISN